MKWLHQTICKRVTDCLQCGKETEIPSVWWYLGLTKRLAITWEQHSNPGRICVKYLSALNQNANSFIQTYNLMRQDEILKDNNTNNSSLRFNLWQFINIGKKFVIESLLVTDLKFNPKINNSVWLLEYCYCFYDIQLTRTLKL